ncbi:Bug family tripartite tricarboxylate transporter substrate binding protein [Ottowia sp. VDI28]|uniref:Bug family tripartite tricarboxylate transporter substrate binding protein n=1 Tax=Ottowia sp. VDI28 TaxID=3133968 RepID=UPI003C30CBC8
MERRTALLGALSAVGLLGGRGVLAQADRYPNRVIRFLQPFSAGSGPDVITRYVMKGMSDRLGQSFVIENRVGASGLVAMRELAKAPPDGYTLSYTNIAIAVSQELLGKDTFSLKHDVAPIGGLSSSFNVLVVPPALPVKDVAGLVALLKAKPGGYSYASGGNGTPAHLNGEIFKTVNGLDVVHVPYKGLAPAITDVSRGDVHFMFGISSSVVPAIKSGRLHALAVAAPKRLAALPDVPTMAEAGFGGNDVLSWSGLVAPPGTPGPVVKRVALALREVLSDPATAEFLDISGSQAVIMSPEEFGRLMASESDRWQSFIRKSGLKTD